MIIAQALGEYAAIAVLRESFDGFSLRIEEVFGQYGMEALVGLVAVGVVWRVIIALK